MASDKYFYPDVGDTSTLIYIENNEPYRGYWEKSENNVLKFFAEICKKKTYKTFLDIGSGDARLLERYEKYFQSVTAIEPDEKRLKIAKQKLFDKRNINYINSTFLYANLEADSFDVILCSHVIELISTENLKRFVDELYKVLKPGGILAVLTAHSRKENDEYLMRYIAYSDIKYKKISKEKFNSLRTNRENILPLHHFSISNLKHLFSQFKIVDIQVFHILHKCNLIDKILFRDDFYNLPFLKKKHGDDVFLFLKKSKKII